MLLALTTLAAAVAVPLAAVLWITWGTLQREILEYEEENERLRAVIRGQNERLRSAFAITGGLCDCRDD